MSKRKKGKKAKPKPTVILCPTPGCGAEFDRLNVASMVVSSEMAALFGGYVAPPVLLICSDCKRLSTPESLDGGKTLTARHLTPAEQFRAEVEVPELIRRGESGDLGGVIGFAVGGG